MFQNVVQLEKGVFRFPSKILSQEINLHDDLRNLCRRLWSSHLISSWIAFRDHRVSSRWIMSSVFRPLYTMNLQFVLSSLIDLIWSRHEFDVAIIAYRRVELRHMYYRVSSYRLLSIIISMTINSNESRCEEWCTALFARPKTECICPLSDFFLYWI